MEKYEALWDRLLAFLNELGSASEVAPGRIRLRLAEIGRDLEIVMTPEEWDHMVSVMWGDFLDAAQAVRRTAFGVTEDERFLVYEDYQLEPSTTPHLPSDPQLERLRALAQENPDQALGHWVALDHEGRVAGRYEDFPDD